MELGIINIIDDMRFCNPTRGKVRVDDGGDGHHNAPRVRRRHDGLDFECKPGGGVWMPVRGQIVRPSLPYKNDLRYRGLYIVNDRIEIKMWYLDPFMNVMGEWREAGDLIGYAQDISRKYSDCTPHIHLRIVRIDPLLLFNV